MILCLAVLVQYRRVSDGRTDKHTTTALYRVSIASRDKNRSRVSLRSTFSNCHVLFRYLHSFCTCMKYIVALGITIAQRASMQYRARHQQTPVQPNLLISTGLYLWSTSVDYHQCCWWHYVLLRQRTVVDADHRGGWTHIFGSKASEFQTVKSDLEGHYQGHWQWCHSIGHIRFPISLPLQLCFHLAPFPSFRGIITYFPKFKEVTWPEHILFGDNLSRML